MEDVSIGPLIGVDFHCCEAAFNKPCASYSRHTHWPVRSMEDVSIGPLINVEWIVIAVKQREQMLRLFIP
jgi:hypothetical protein